MNIVDWVVLGILGVSVLFGVYRGFIASVLNAGGTLLALGLSFVLSPKLAGFVQSDPSLQRTLLSYTDVSSRIGDLETATTSVFSLDSAKISEIVSRAGLPEPLSSLLRSNLENRIYTGISTVSEYVSETIVSACVNVICFLITFVLLMIVLTLLTSLLKSIFKFPVLKQLNGLAGGAFGLIRGVVCCFAIFALVPLVETVVPMEQVSELIDRSSMASIFNSGALVRAVMNGRLF